MRVIFFFCLFIIPFLAGAQGGLEDVLYLKNGAVYRGTLLPSIDSAHYRIEIVGSNVMVVALDEVALKSREKAAYVLVRAPRTPQANGWYGEMSVGLPMGLSQWGSLISAVSLHGFAGYQIKQNIKVGLGSGFEAYNEAALLLPLFGRITGDLTRKLVTPFYQADVGYGFNMVPDNDMQSFRGGASGFLGGGIKFNSRSTFYFNILTGIRIQYASSYINSNWWWEPYTEYYRYNRIETRLSFGF
ncbi:MAG: hypothetical protein HYZ16_05025 [Bacteroidetes bacterium]|jgi:hypothetical protein|nr:hypothetical protein [Bacteroidota bacterium]